MNHSNMGMKSLVIGLVSVMLLATAVKRTALANEPIKISVPAIRSVEMCLKKWESTAAYWSQKIGNTGRSANLALLSRGCLHPMIPVTVQDNHNIGTGIPLTPASDALRIVGDNMEHFPACHNNVNSDLLMAVRHGSCVFDGIITGLLNITFVPTIDQRCSSFL